MEVIRKDYNILYKIIVFLIAEKRSFTGHDARLCWRTVSHLAGLLVYASVVVYAAACIELAPSDHVLMDNVYRYQFGYSSGWNFIFQIIFLSLSLACDVLQWRGEHQSERVERLTYYRDVIFSGLVVPLSLFITLMFWSVYLVDRELVFPRVYDRLVPLWFNHCVHSVISGVVLLETVLQPRPLPRDRRAELGLVGGFGAIVYYSIYWRTGRWLYALFGLMSWWQLSLFQLTIWGSTLLFYLLQFPLNRLFHGEGNLQLEDKRL